jgi:hypothetical protein
LAWLWLGFGFTCKVGALVMDMTFLCLPFSKSRKKALSSGSSLMEVVRRLWSRPITQTIYGSYSFILCGITTIAVDLAY